MDNTEIDNVAQALHDAWAREYHGGKIKWGHIGPEERSVWRHVARVAQTVVGAGAAKEKPATKPVPPAAAKPGAPARPPFPGAKR